MPKKPSANRNKGGAAAVPLPDRRVLGSLLAALGGNDGSSEVEAAQEIMWDAWDSDDRRRRVELAKKALKISPLCADAYVILALETARNADEALQLYRQGVEAGEKALGKTAFRDEVGHFWGILETRPYMRALGEGRARGGRDALPGHASSQSQRQPRCSMYPA